MNSSVLKKQNPRIEWMYSSRKDISYRKALVSLNDANYGYSAGLPGNPKLGIEFQVNLFYHLIYSGSGP